MEIEALTVSSHPPSTFFSTPRSLCVIDRGIPPISPGKTQKFVSKQNADRRCSPAGVDRRSNCADHGIMRFLAAGPTVMERLCLSLCLVILLVLLPSVVLADRVTLENGTVIQGDSVAIKELVNPAPSALDFNPKPNPARLLLIDQGYKRYIVPNRQVRQDVDEQQLQTSSFFELSQDRSTGDEAIFRIGLPRKVTPFDEHGVRTVTLNGPGNQAIEIVQGITRIGPEYLAVEGLNRKWWQGIATETFPPGRLVQLIHSAIDPKDPDDRLGAARFLIQAGLYEIASLELAEIARDFPDLEARIAAIKRELNQLRAGWLLAEVRQRREAGQHRLALGIIKSFPTGDGFDAAVLQQVKSLRDSYEETRQRADEILYRLGKLEATLDNDEQRQIASEMRLAVSRRLEWNSIDRFDAFLTLAEDDSLPATDRLALAYSGWMTGSANASTDFAQTLHLWDARWLVSEYLRARDVAQESQILASLASIEGIGPTQIADLIPFLPPWVDSPGIKPLQVSVLETIKPVPGWGGQPDDGKTLLTEESGPVRYAVVLPPGYTPTRVYPLIVALRPAEWSIESEASFWAVRQSPSGRAKPGPAAQAGYIVIAPEYAGPKQATYQFSARAHRAIIAAIRDAKRRFMIDSNRVFLAGHGMGADATFDLALSQPHFFAGAVPISGLFQRHIQFEKASPPRVPLYVVNGQLDRNARAVHGEDIADLMHHGHDIIYCEYVGRGYEYYAGEVKNILTWMGRIERVPAPKEINAQVARTSDTRQYWLTAEDIPTRFLVGRPSRRGVMPNPATLEARISPGNTLTIESSDGRFILRLNSDLVSLKDRLRVRLDTRQHFHDFVEPNTADLLENFKETGDRQRLYPIRLRVE